MILAIDPSISDLGWAVGDKEDIYDYGHKRTYSRWDLDRRAKEIQDEIKEKIDEYAVDTILYEMPKSFRHNKTRGIETWLKFGVSLGAFLTIEGVQTQQVSPQKWKGSQSKEDTKLLTKNVIGEEISNHNASDACGILIWWQRQPVGDQNG